MAASRIGLTEESLNSSPSRPVISQDIELQKMLADEKMRCEQHKTNYRTLKAEHTRLQDEYVELQNEMRTTIEESKLVQEKYSALCEQARKEVADRQGELESVKAKVLSGQKLEMLKLEIAEEVEKPYKSKFQQMDMELEQCRSEYNKLKYDFSFLKSEYEHEKQENQRVVEEFKLRHESEVANLRKERETYISRQQNDSKQDVQKVRQLQRENAQLNLKMKGLLTELEEIRAQREHMGFQSDSVSRLQAKQIAEHAANVKALTTEKDSLKLQNENLQRELGAVGDLQNDLTAKIHELEKENLLLKNRAEEIGHKSKVEVTNLKMEMLKERGGLERERDRLRNEIEELTSQLDIAKHSHEKQNQSLIEKEREAVKRVQAAREEEWQKLHTVETEKMELETRIQEIERQKIDEETRLANEKERLEEKVRASVDAKDTAEREALILRTKLDHQKALLEQIEQERYQSSEMKTRLHRMETQYTSSVSNEQQLSKTNRMLQDEVDMVRREMSRVKEELSHYDGLAEKALARHRTSWEEEKHNLQQRVHELETELSQMHNKVTQVALSQKKKKKKYSKLVSKMKNKMTLMKAKLEELQIEREALKKCVPSDAHAQMKRQYKDLVRRHQEFRNVMLMTGDNRFAESTHFSHLSASTPMNASGAVPHWKFSESEQRHQDDLALLKERLDQLDDNQRQQLAELKIFSLSPIKNKTASYIDDDDENYGTSDHHVFRTTETKNMLEVEKDVDDRLLTTRDLNSSREFDTDV